MDPLGVDAATERSTGLPALLSRALSRMGWCCCCFCQKPTYTRAHQSAPRASEFSIDDAFAVTDDGGSSGDECTPEPIPSLGARSGFITARHIDSAPPAHGLSLDALADCGPHVCADDFDHNLQDMGSDVSVDEQFRPRPSVSRTTSLDPLNS